MLSQQKKAILAVLASLGLHILFLLLWALAVELLPHGKPQAPPEPDKPFRLTIETEKLDVSATPTPTPVPAVTRPPSIPFADTTGMVEAATPPPDTKVQSARNTIAASEQPAESTGDGPTQRGRAVPTFALNTVEYQRGSQAPPPDAAPAATPLPQTAPPLPRAVAQSTPPPEKLAPKPALRPTQFALSTPASLPTLPTDPTPEPNPFDPAFRPPSNMTEPARPTPVPTRDYYRPQAYKTAAKGGVATVGSSSIASASTPTGRYQTLVRSLVQQRWNGYIESRMDLMNIGTVTISFLVGMDGKARNVQITSNSGNAALDAISLQAISEVRLPPMPADAVPATSGGQLPMDLTFEVIDPPHL